MSFDFNLVSEFDKFDFFSSVSFASVTCPDHWYPAAGDCVKLFKEKKPWEEAGQMCQTMGAKPLTIPT